MLNIIKNIILYPILGLLASYLGNILLALILGGFTYFDINLIAGLNGVSIKLLSLISAAFGSWVFYKFLYHHWSKIPEIKDIDILDDDFLNQT